jgi:2,4-diaminopentanoate dehydrogenase
VIGKSGGRERIVIDHITRIHPSCAPDWPQPDQGAGDHRVIVHGDTELTLVSRADVPGGTRADGGNTTAANRLLGAIGWLATQKPGIYDGLDVPLHARLSDEAAATRWAD